ncbi:DHA2 family efflux MFS transporter permease subunit [Paenibacillus sp. 1001270B_150601_E10]|uniref:DHA2 family efflux MFS transporter permease subunit n=1 Tax=Paenibacillus sp. 1001270B_150601_E10 TaxID=2787079 RepID=UPI001E38FC73|nr:DHA2 family efflux MFS transporter permease subunit [Paenibacillus sp. 1001270B_150601_E10]
MEEKSLSNKTFWTIMFAIFFGNFLAVLATNTVNVALPVLMKHFDVDLPSIQWVLTGFMLATGTVAPAIGFFGHRFSTKRLYLFALGGFIVASIMCALSWNEGSLVFFRIIQGTFSGMIMPTTMAIVYQVIPKQQQAFGISIWSLSAMLAPAIGPTLAGGIIYMADWHWLFWLNVPIGLVAMFAVWKFIPMYRIGGHQRFDSLGFALVIVGSILLLLSFGNGAAWGWLSVKTFTFFAIGAVLIAAFIFRSSKLEHPLLNFSVFRYFRFTMSIVLVSIITISLYAGGLLTPLFLQQVQGESALTAGLVLLPASLLMASLIPFTGRWYERFGPVKLIVTGLVFMAIGTFALSCLDPGMSKLEVTLWMAFRNVGIALANTPAMNAGMSAVKREWAGYASSINNWIRQGLASLSIGLFSALLASQTIAHLQQLQAEGHAMSAELQKLAYTQGINDVNMIGFLLTLLAIPAALLLKLNGEISLSSKKQKGPASQAMQHNKALSRD